MAHDLVAGYWSDIDFRNEVGGFTAAVHDKDATDEISLKLFDETRHFLKKYVNSTEFSPKTIILGTWYKGTPHPSSSYVGTNEVEYFCHSFIV